MYKRQDLFNHRATPNVEMVDEDGEEEDEAQMMTMQLKQDSEIVDGEPTELFISYGGETSADRFLVLFGFVDDFQKHCYSELVFPDPTQEHQDLGCNDRLKMVFRCQDGAVAGPVYDCILYAVLHQVDQTERDRFYQAHVKKDSELKSQIHTKYAAATDSILLNHVEVKLSELETLSERVKQVDPESDALEMIRKHNEFMTRVLTKVRSRLK